MSGDYFGAHPRALESSRFRRQFICKRGVLKLVGVSLQSWRGLVGNGGLGPRVLMVLVAALRCGPKGAFS